METNPKLKPVNDQSWMYNIDAEQSVLGSILVDPSVFEGVSSEISENDFYLHAHRKIYRAINEVIKISGTVDHLTAESQLKDSGHIDEVGGFAYLIDLSKNTPSSKNVMSYVDIVLKHSNKRKIKSLTDSYIDSEIGTEEYQSEVAKLAACSNSTGFNVTFGSEGYDNRVNWLIKNYIPKESFGVVFGASGSYKTFHVLDWACCVATGKDWDGNKSHKGGVVYIAGEGANGVKRRIRAWEVANKEDAGENLAVIGHAVDFLEPSNVSMMISTIRSMNNKCELIVVDTLARCFGGDENSNTDMNIFVQACDRIKEKTGCSVLVVHHTGKDEAKGARGASSLRAADDFEFRVSKNEDKEYILTCTKSKDSEEPEQLAYCLDEQNLGFSDEDGKPVKSMARIKSGYVAVDNKKDGDAMMIVTAILKSQVKKGDGIAREALRDEVCFQYDSGMKQDSKRRKFTRAFKKSVDNGYIYEQNGFVYLTEDLD